MSRARPGLPQPPDDLPEFPAESVDPGTELSRAHRAGREPWWFASSSTDPSTGGRFDVPPPSGTCYVALDPATALRERFGHALVGARVIGEREVADVELAVLSVAAPVTVADTASVEAEGTITRELVTTTDYALTQRWAAAFLAAGWGGILHESRFTLRARAAALALFGDAGVADWPVGRRLDPVDELSSLGIEVSDGFSVRHARVIEPPQR